MRYIEVVGGMGIWRCDSELIGGDPITGYTFYTGYSTGSGRKIAYGEKFKFSHTRGGETVNIGDFTRKNVARYLEEIRGDASGLPVEDFHAVFDDKEIPWATKEGCEEYRRIMELAEKRKQDQTNRIGAGVLEDLDRWLEHEFPAELPPAMRPAVRWAMLHAFEQDPKNWMEKGWTALCKHVGIF